MQITEKIVGIVRILIGILIASYGMLRIIFLKKYIEFVVFNFNEIIPDDATLTMGFAILPFVELFIGLLIIFKIEFKRSIIVALILTILVAFFFIYEQMYIILMYHVPVMVLLLWLYGREITDTHNHLFNYSKGKIYTGQR
jgi:hypothetical protein